MKKKLFSIFLGAAAFCLISSCSGGDESRLKIYSYETKAEIKQKIQSKDWAQKVLDNAHESVDKYVKIHETDPEWILSRMQMYWKNKYTTPIIHGSVYSHAEGEAPVPTVRFTGARDWASPYSMPKIEDIKPYMDYNDDQMYLQNNNKGGEWEWVDNNKTAHIIENINVNIMNCAMNSAFIYWLTGEEKYAKFSYDIFTRYIDAMSYRKAPICEVDLKSQHIIGLTSFEVIHEKVVYPLTMCYDFIYSYLEKNNADFDKIHTVFQNFADQIIKNGVADNNWNIFQARYITYIALTLKNDEDYANGKGKNHYLDVILNQTSAHQKALREVCNTYDKGTYFWNESPGYSLSTTKDIVEVLWLIDGIENKNILKDFKVIEDAALASFEYLLPNKYTTGFGDSHYGYLPFSMYESLLALHSKYGETDKVNAISSILNEQIKIGAYNREEDAEIYKLFNYVSDIAPEANETLPLYSSVFYTPNINLSIQRNGMDKETGLMISNAGSGFNHHHENGINLELYGKGYPLAVDLGPGSSYWVSDHNEYFKKAISHNTVLIDGVSTNSSERFELGGKSEYYELLSSYPEINKKDAFEALNVSYVDNKYLEASTQSEQRRLNSIIRTSPTSGYYVDIFRSHKENGGDLKHEYIYHNLGQSLTLETSEGKNLAMANSSDLTSKGGQVKGYDYLTNKKEANYSGNFKGTFAMDFGDFGKSVNMDVWMKGDANRKIFSVTTPHSIKGFKEIFPDNIAKLDIPALIVRQNGEAWNRPFVAIYEPYYAKEGKTIKSVDYLSSNNKEFVGIKVSSSNNNVEYILNMPNTENNAKINENNAEFKGTYAVVSFNNDKLNYILLGDGQNLKFEDYAITSNNENTSVLVEYVNDELHINNSHEVELQMPDNGKTELTYLNAKGEKVTVKGTSSNNVVKYKIAAL